MIYPGYMPPRVENVIHYYVMKLKATIIGFLMLSIFAVPAATVTTFAGTGAKGFSGDGGSAISAQPPASRSSANRTTKWRRCPPT